MKKFSKVVACAAVCAMLGTMALAGCDTGSHLSEEQLTEANTAITSVTEYNGSFTVKETAEAEFAMSVEYENATHVQKELMAADGFVTYNAEDSSMAYIVSEDYSVYQDDVLVSDSNGLMSSYYFDFDLGLYTYLNNGTYTQYQDYSNSTKYKYTYTSAGGLTLYYTSLSEMIEGLCGIDLESAAECTTEEEYNLFWQDNFASYLTVVSTYTGVELSYKSGESTYAEEDGYKIYTFGAEIDTTSVTVNVGSLEYTVAMYVDSTTGLVTKLVMNVDQSIPLTSVVNSTTVPVTITNKATTVDEFIYSATTDRIPAEADLTGYTQKN